MAQMRGFVSKTGRKVLTEADRVAIEREKQKRQQPIPIRKEVEEEIDMKSMVGIVESTMDTIEELNRTVEALSSVMNSVLQNTEAVKQLIAKSNESGWLNTNSLQKSMQGNERVVASIKQSIDANSSAMAKYLEGASGVMKTTSSLIDKSVSRLKEFQSLTEASKNAVVTSSQIVQMNSDTMKTVKNVVEESGKNTTKIASAISGIEASINATDETMKLSGHVMQLVIDKLRDIKLSAIKEVPVQKEWTKLNVSITKRDYRGQIQELGISKD